MIVLTTHVEKIFHEFIKIQIFFPHFFIIFFSQETRSMLYIFSFCYAVIFTKVQSSGLILSTYTGNQETVD